MTDGTIFDEFNSAMNRITGIKKIKLLIEVFDGPNEDESNSEITIRYVRKFNNLATNITVVSEIENFCDHIKDTYTPNGYNNIKIIASGVLTNHETFSINR